MKYTVRIETTIKNGVETKKGFLDGQEMSLQCISRILTNTKNECLDGIFSNGEIEFYGENEEWHRFSFTSEKSIQERVDEIIKYFTQNDKHVVEEYAINNNFEER